MNTRNLTKLLSLVFLLSLLIASGCGIKIEDSTSDQANEAEQAMNLKQEQELEEEVQQYEQEEEEKKQPAKVESSEEDNSEGISPDVSRQIERLGSSDPIERAYAAYHLGQKGAKAAPAVPALVGIIRDKTPLRRTYSESKFAGDYTTPGNEAAIALGKIGDVLAVEPLCAALKNVDSWVIQQSVAIALGKIGDSRAVEPLVSVLQDEALTILVRTKAVEALGKIGDAGAVEPLIIALKDKDSSIRNLAAIALGEIGDSRAVEPLGSALKDSHPNVQWEAVTALVKIDSDRAVEILITALRIGGSRIRNRAVEELVEIGDPAVEPLIAVLEDEDVSVQKYATDALGRIGDVRAVEPLLLAASKAGPSTLGKTQVALREIGEPAVEPLIAALQDEDSSVRRWAAWALGEIGDARAVEPLIAALNDRDFWVRRTTAEALEKITGQELGRDRIKWQKWW